MLQNPQRRQRQVLAAALTVVVALGVSLLPTLPVPLLDPLAGAPAGAAPLAAPAVGLANTRSGAGFLVVTARGDVLAFGDAVARGSLAGRPLVAPIVGIAADPDGQGYWLAAADGGVFAFDAPFLGSIGGRVLNQPVVGIAARPSGGYWLVARDGGIFSFGAPFRGSTGGRRLNQPVVGMAADPDGDGYWLVAADGGIFSFAARFGGSLGGRPIVAPVTAMAAARGGGYWLSAADGGVFALGGAPFLGSRGGTALAEPLVALAPTPSGAGYRLAGRDALVFPFGDAGPIGQGQVGTPVLSVSSVRGGLDVPWDVEETPTGVLLYTERAGRLWARAGGVDRLIGRPGDVFASGEAGLLGLAVDPDHASNRRFYVCQSWTGGSGRDVRVYAWELAADGASARRLEPALVSGLPGGSGRHNGCRPEVGPDGFLWIGTGDAAICGTAQARDGLGGKVLRVDRFSGGAAPGNPFGTRIYTFGHRNVQGLAFRPGTNQVFSVEHGPDRDDEVNLLRAGGNSGWAPGCPYVESVPMTDLRRFPDAMQPVWTSGRPTVAPSGAVFLRGPSWRAWEGGLVLAMLKGAHLRLLFLDAGGRVTGEQRLLADHGRLRSVTVARDGTLLVTTANGGGRDEILRLTPS